MVFAGICCLLKNNQLFFSLCKRSLELVEHFVNIARAVFVWFRSCRPRFVSVKMRFIQRVANCGNIVIDILKCDPMATLRV